MELVGQAVKHKTFGKGVITESTPSFVTVLFQNAEKKFIYPDAFGKYLVLKDEDLQEEVSEEYEEELKAKEEEKEEINRKYERLDKLRSINNSENSQAVFNVSENEIDEIFNSGKVFTGRYASGERKGSPKQAVRLKPNSACLITTLGENEDELERRIKAIFMVSEDFYGAQSRDGIVTAHPKYKLLIKNNADLKLWDYLEKQDKIQSWGKTAFKYMSSSATKKIIYDIAISFKGSENWELAKTFYKYFCLTNQFREKEFPED